MTRRALPAVTLAALLPFACHPSQDVKAAEMLGVDVACIVAAAEGATPAELEACRLARAAVSAQPASSGSAP